MSSIARISFLLLVFLYGCGPQEEPEVMVGEDQAASVVLRFMRALEAGDLDRAKDFLHEKTDSTLSDLNYCRQLFFAVPNTGMETQAVGHENYGGEWHISVELKVSYGERMKLLCFTLVEGEPPSIRALNPIIP